VAVAGPDGSLTSQALQLDGDRQQIRADTVAAVLTLLRDRLG
jgi:nicotinamide mononucleotide (NMN) deamidase PncC